MATSSTVSVNGAWSLEIWPTNLVDASSGGRARPSTSSTNASLKYASTTQQSGTQQAKQARSVGKRNFS
jgi:hypothetical protein